MKGRFTGNNTLRINGIFWHSTCFSVFHQARDAAGELSGLHKVGRFEVSVTDGPGEEPAGMMEPETEV